MRLKQDHSELVILAVLADGPAYGYAITKQVGARSDGAIRLGPSQLYPLLSKMERAKLVSARWEEVKASGSDPDARGRRRKWYDLSPKGRRRLEQRVEAHRRLTLVINSFIGAVSVQGAEA